MPESDLDLLVRAARDSGRIATRYWKRAPDTWQKKKGAGPVTEADIEIDNMLRESLRAVRPGYGWLSEETADTPERLNARRVFIVDPIDGTRAFIRGSRDFAHSLAVAEGGEITAAVIYLPLLECMFTATSEGPACLNGREIRADRNEDLARATVLAHRNSLDPDLWHGGMPPIQRAFRSSLAYRLALVAEGRFHAMLTLRPTWEWDVAAGSLIAEKAGARVTDRTGAALRFNNPAPCVNGLIVAAEPLHGNLIGRLKQ